MRFGTIANTSQELVNLVYSAGVTTARRRACGTVIRQTPRVLVQFVRCHLALCGGPLFAVFSVFLQAVLTPCGQNGLNSS